MKAEMIQSISTSLTNTASWRLGLQEKHPDHRNARAAKLLAKLAEDAANLSDMDWELLRSHFESNRWAECVRQVSRLVGFAHRKASLAFFLRNLIRLLDEPATAT